MKFNREEYEEFHESKEDLYETPEEYMRTLSRSRRNELKRHIEDTIMDDLFGL